MHGNHFRSTKKSQFAATNLSGITFPLLFPLSAFTHVKIAFPADVTEQTQTPSLGN